jgi:hypothetical protein
MKTIYALGIFLVLAASVQSQESWGPPFPLTDSLTDNVNATLSIIPADMIQADTLFMLWERSSDTSTTEIYARNLTSMGAPFFAAGQPNTHFRHPRVFKRGIGDTLFYFSYETNMNGNYDLYYSILLRNGTTLGPFPFIRSSQDEVGLNFWSPESFCWEKAGRIYGKQAYTDTTLLCSDSCSNPVQSEITYVAYEMATGTSLGVFFSVYNDISHTWSGSFPVDITGTNTKATFGNDSYAANFSSSLLWQHQDSDYWKIKGFDLSSATFLSFNNFPNCNNVSPSFCNIVMITDQGMPFFAFFSTFASDVTGNMETYVNPMYDTTYQNISQYAGSDTHPQLFNNCYWSGIGLDNQLYIIWESNRNGHWQLWATTMDILTGENTLKGSPGERIRCYPNPSAKISTIEFREPSGSGSIEISDLSGKKIKTLMSSRKGSGLYTAEWDGRNAAGAMVPAGIYFGSVKTHEGIQRCKIIRR